VTDLPKTFEIYAPPEVPRMADGEAQEIAKDLLLSLVHAVFQEVDAEQVVDNSQVAFRLNMWEQERVAKLIDTAVLNIEVSWNE